ncbi:hypothetical protein ANN_26853 [Periplaneta americana]|uniref:Major facilitator superfamily (MFS) profile domain-containing protein n=1 Tax=Periplaneta americana TaxID=6978 RepID=A0ABQ8RZI1_PERAM|nr:hypothetical protein ANN_26853 [Periplaneta americana]
MSCRATNCFTITTINTSASSSNSSTITSSNSSTSASTETASPALAIPMLGTAATTEWWSIFAYFLDVAIVNAWFLYRKMKPQNSSEPLLNFYSTEKAWGNALGTVVMFILGSILQKNWRLIAGLSVIVPVLSILVVWCFLPESPIWLLSKGRIKEAEISLKRVRNVPPDQNLPAAFSGCTIIMFYALSIVSDMGVNVDTYVATVVLSVARLVVVVALSYASKRFGRRALCNVSGVGMSLSLTALALFSGLMHADVIDSEEAYRFNWIPVTSLLLFVVTSSLGFFWLPASMMGELFPTKIRGSAAGFTGLMGCCLFFLVVKLYPYLKETMRYHNVFILYAVISVIGTIVMYFYLPETQGKTLAEIEQYFKSGERATRAEHKSLTSLEIHSTKEDNVSSETSRLTCN